MYHRYNTTMSCHEFHSNPKTQTKDASQNSYALFHSYFFHIAIGYSLVVVYLDYHLSSSRTWILYIIITTERLIQYYIMVL